MLPHSTEFAGPFCGPTEMERARPREDRDMPQLHSDFGRAQTMTLEICVTQSKPRATV
jgi:hypothetical protein